MNGARAIELLRGLRQQALRVTAEEIDEVLAAGLAVEADPDDLSSTQWLGSLLAEEVNVGLADPAGARASLTGLLQKVDENLKSDWYRMKSSKEELAHASARRVTLRRAIGLLADPSLMGRVAKVIESGRSLAPEARWVACPELGSEVYALTHKGYRVLGQLEARLARFAQVPLKTFLHGFDKAEAKMFAFSNEVAALSAHVGHVKKNREQVVIGLVKAGGAVDDTIAAYKRALGRTDTPDKAVTCTRNAAQLGGVDDAARKLREAEKALKQAGFPQTPLVLGCAKSLLGFAPEPGIARFKELHRLMQQQFGPQEANFKFAARAMSAGGMPADIMRRVQTASSTLMQIQSTVTHAQNVPRTAVALASMVRTNEAVPEIVERFRRIQTELARVSLSDPANIEADALECTGCPGTPEEIAATVRALLGQLTSGRAATRADLAIAMSFAKRFAY